MGNKQGNKIRGPLVRCMKVTARIVLLISLLFAIALGCFCFIVRHYMATTSYVNIENQAGLNVEFQKVIVDNQVIGESSGVVTSGGAFSPSFRAPADMVELKVVIITAKRERETVSCTLDNRWRPCGCRAIYTKSKLSCECWRKLFP